MRDTAERSKSQALAIYLFWMKTGCSQDIIATYFGLEGRRTVSRYISQVRKCLSGSFVKKNLGPSHLKRKEWLKHSNILASELFSTQKDQQIAVADGKKTIRK